VVKKILVVGGNGFIGAHAHSLFLRAQCPKPRRDTGSAVCRAALSKGIEVTSVRCAWPSSLLIRKADKKPSLSVTSNPHQFIGKAIPNTKRSQSSMGGKGEEPSLLHLGRILNKNPLDR
jgi:hypothetical protein